ncbi:MAG TPA: efflux transporter outer membrane subunit [Terriglobales bacterium]|jgi:multidrug efflux system outer membrane protein
MRKAACLILLALGLSGCAVGPKYKRPVITAPDKYYTEQTSDPNSIADLAWWEIFKDPVLQNLIQEALKNNYDVATAAARVEQARAQAGISKSFYYPQIGYGVGVGGQKAELVPNHTYYNYNVNLAWELDLWGRIRKLNEQQKAIFFATHEAQRGVWLSLVSDVAQAYFELRALDEQLQIAKDTAVSFQESYDLFNKKLSGGAASALETSRAEGAMADVLAQVPDLERQIVAKENQISLLLGKNPGEIPRGASLAEQHDLDTLPAGLPSTLLERRPDLRQAEQQLVAANAAIGVAKANFFPVISLTGLLGGVSPQLSGLVSSGTQWSVAGNIAGPLFTGGRLKNEYKFAFAQRDEAQSFYAQSVTQAFGEVSTALSAHQKLAESMKQEARSVSAYQESVRLANLRYDSGLSAYFEVIDAKLNLFPVELTFVQYDLGRKVALVNLYRALGGGWKLTDLDWTKSATNSNPAQQSPSTTNR